MQKFSEIQKHLIESNFKQAENDLDSIEIDGNAEEILSSALRSYIFLGLNNLDSSREFADKVIEFVSSKTLNYSKIGDEQEITYQLNLAKGIAYFISGTIAFVDGSNEEARERLNRAKQIFETNAGSFEQNLLSDVLNRIATVENRVGNNEKAIELLTKSLEIRLKLGLKSKVGASMYNLGTIHFQSGNYEKAENYLTETATIYNELGNSLGIAYCKMELGGIYQYQGKVKQALENFIDAHEMYKEYGSEIQIAWSLTDLGNIYQKIGEVDKSLKYYHEADQIYERSNDRRIYANHQRAMAISYRMKGDISKAIELNNLALEIYRELGNSNYEGRALFQLAEDHFELQQYQNSLDLLQKAKNIFQELEHYPYLAKTYFTLIRTYIEMENEMDAMRYKEKLAEINSNFTTPLIDQLSKLSSVLLNLREGRMESFVNSLNILNEIVTDEVKDVNYTNLSFLLLLEIYIKEYKLSYNPDILEIIKDTLIKIEELAISQNSPQLEIRLHLINSKFRLVLRDFDSALTSVQKAVEISKAKGFDNLYKIAELMQAELDSDANRIKAMFENEDNLDQLIERAGLDQFIGNLINSKFHNIELDHAHLISIIANNGVSIYNHKFSEELNIDDQLLAGFITALSTFTKETFDHNSLLEQIKIGKNNVLLKPMNEYLLCFLYSGSYISAQHRIDKLASKLEGTEIKNIIVDSITSSQSLPEIDMQEIIDSVF